MGTIKKRLKQVMFKYEVRQFHFINKVYPVFI